MSRQTLPSNQQRHDNVAVIKLKKGGCSFEIACYRNKAMSYRKGIEKDLNEVLQIERIFTNVGKGMFANIKDVRKHLGSNIPRCKFLTDDELERAVCKYILDSGDMQLNEMERKAELDHLLHDVATTVASKSVHPETRRPYPVSMILSSLQKIGYAPSNRKPAKTQASEAIKLLMSSNELQIERAPMYLRASVPPGYLSTLLSHLSSQKNVKLLKQDSDMVDFLISPDKFRAVDEVVRKGGAQSSLQVIANVVTEDGEGKLSYETIPQNAASESIQSAEHPGKNGDNNNDNDDDNDNKNETSRKVNKKGKKGKNRKRGANDSDDEDADEKYGAVEKRNEKKGEKRRQQLNEEEEEEEEQQQINNTKQNKNKKNNKKDKSKHIDITDTKEDLKAQLMKLGLNDEDSEDDKNKKSQNAKRKNKKKNVNNNNNSNNNHNNNNSNNETEKTPKKKDKNEEEEEDDEYITEALRRKMDKQKERDEKQRMELLNDPNYYDTDFDSDYEDFYNNKESEKTLEEIRKEKEEKRLKEEEEKQKAEEEANRETIRTAATRKRRRRKKGEFVSDSDEE